MKQMEGPCKQGYENSGDIKCWGSFTALRGTIFLELCCLLKIVKFLINIKTANEHGSYAKIT